MSHSRKHVKTQALDDYPTPQDGQTIVRVSELRGGNLLEVEYPNKDRILCLLPAKFHKTIWVKRGNYLIVEPFTELLKTKDVQAKIKGRVVHVLLFDHVKQLQKTSIWPSGWKDEIEKQTTKKMSSEEEDNMDSEEELDSYLINTNHQTINDSDEESSSEESSDEDSTD